jgi:hypothetical protein
MLDPPVRAPECGGHRERLWDSELQISFFERIVQILNSGSSAGM